MKNTPQELKELFGDNANAIERVLLVTMLQEALAGSPVAGAALHGVQILKPGDDVSVCCLPLDCFEPVTETTNPTTP